MYNYFNFSYEEAQINGDIEGSEAGYDGQISLLSETEDELVYAHSDITTKESRDVESSEPKMRHFHNMHKMTIDITTNRLTGGSSESGNLV